MASQTLPGILCCAHAAGRGDLVRLVQEHGIPREHAAALLGFDIVEMEVDKLPRSQAVTVGMDVAIAKAEPEPAGKLPLWRAIGPVLREPVPADRQPPSCLVEAHARSGAALFEG